MRLTPRQCLQLQLSRMFSATLGVCELEIVARHVMVDLAYQDRWDCWLNSEDYGRSETTYCNWRSPGWVGKKAIERTFDSWVVFYDEQRKSKFRVSDQFIERMHYVDPIEDDVVTLALAEQFNLELKESV